MKPETYKALLKDLQKLQKTLVASQIATVRRDPVQAARFARLHAEAEVGGRIDDFVATAARKSTVLFLLRTVFVCVLEDLGILGLKRIRGDWGFAAFREVAPALDHRAYFAFVFRDLAVDFPALFAPGDDELPLPDADGCVEVWALWHHPNRDGEHYIWDGDGFDSRFLGDLYQDLDKDIRKRYALLQTPRFVEEYILNHTLTPALAKFDPAALATKNETFRLIDPTCGSGHFLIGAFHRLSNYWRDRHNVAEQGACELALESIWGCDINPHAVDIAAFRLLLEFVARTGVTDLDRLAALRLNVRTVDSLIPWERAKKQDELFAAKDRLDAYATDKQRRDNAAFFGQDFHAVVGNPPYITPKETQKKNDYRAFWPQSAAGKYALSAPFAERILSLGVPGAFTGQITANSFMKRDFGVRLVEQVLPKWDVTAVIDTSGAFIPGHGTPTLIIFAQCSPPTNDSVWAILGKRGEPKRPQVPERGQVWMAIAGAQQVESDDSPFITSAMVARSTFASHPWSLGGGPSAHITEHLVESSDRVLQDVLLKDGSHRMSPGWTSNIGEDDVWLRSPRTIRDRSSSEPQLLPITLGEDVRDYFVASSHWTVYPYAAPGSLLPLASGGVFRELWPFRTNLQNRKMFGVPMVIRGLEWWRHIEHYPKRVSASLALMFPFVTTHNHFALDSRSGTRLSKTTARVILLEDQDLEHHLDLLGLLNSSVLALWFRQVLHCKGAQGVGEGIKSEQWEQFYEFDCTKVQQAPLTSKDRSSRVALARRLHELAEERARCLPAAVFSSSGWSPASLRDDLDAAHLKYVATGHMMVALQEELDWLSYASYGLLESVDVALPADVEPLSPGHRPFEIVMARQDADCDEDERSAWWSRHGFEKTTEIPDAYSEKHRLRLQQRIDHIDSDMRIALLETPAYKRRWQVGEWAAQTKSASAQWLLDSLERLFSPVSDAESVNTGLTVAKPYRLEEISAAWSREPRVATVAGLWSGTGASVDLTVVAEKLLRSSAIPDNPNRVYSDDGYRKVMESKRVWALQDQEDEWVTAVADATAKGLVPPTKRLVDPDAPHNDLVAMPAPPKFEKSDFVRPEYFAIRGKLNVPRERFVMFADLQQPRFGWSGWRDRDRAVAQVEAFSLAETSPDQPLPLPTHDEPRRCGVTFGLWESLPDVKRWGAADEHAELQSLAQEACRQSRCPCPVLGAWKAQVLRGEQSGDGALVALSTKDKGTGKRPDSTKSNDGSEAGTESTVSLHERAWIAVLLETGNDLDLAGILALHRRYIDDVAPSSGGLGEQLRISGVAIAVPAEVRAIDEARLAIVVDDLVASGDLSFRGRGKKKRYQLVPRATRT